MIGLIYKPPIGTAERRIMEIDFNYAIDPRLAAMLMLLAFWVWREFGKAIWITCLNRDDATNAAVDGKPKSSHKSGRAADLRSSNFLPVEIEKIIDYVRSTWGSKFVHIIHHDSGRGEHIHMNINYPFTRGEYGPQKRSI